MGGVLICKVSQVCQQVCQLSQARKWKKKSGNKRDAGPVPICTFHHTYTGVRVDAKCPSLSHYFNDERFSAFDLPALTVRPHLSGIWRSVNPTMHKLFKSVVTVRMIFYKCKSIW